MNKPLRIALTKGRLEKDAIALMERVGLDCQSLRDKGRRLILPLPDIGAEVVLAKAADVITYVESGVCDMGIVGKDTILENASSLYELLDLGFGRCRFALAVKKGDDFFAGYGAKTIATKYPRITRRYFEKQSMDVSVVKIEGSVELAPLLGLADGIVDIVETGVTLRENGLEVSRWICDISARLAVNIASLKLRKEEIESLVARLEQGLDQEK
ncbi:MAG: ATP phosphoribosyltransferase [Oscillospiraceae bacterium]|nr:ATP phosphoribosyltransferase [Oscillospiraceae bacterium]